MTILLSLPVGIDLNTASEEDLISKLPQIVQATLRETQESAKRYYAEEEKRLQQARLESVSNYNVFGTCVLK